MSSRISLDVDWTTPIEEKYAQVKLDHESPGFLVIIPKKYVFNHPPVFFFRNYDLGTFVFINPRPSIILKNLGEDFCAAKPYQTWGVQKTVL